MRDDHVMCEENRRLILLELVSRDQKCTGRDPILVVTILPRAKRKVYNEVLSKRMSIIVLPHLIIGGPAKAAFNAQRGHFHFTYGTDFLGGGLKLASPCLQRQFRGILHGTWSLESSKKIKREARRRFKTSPRSFRLM